MGKRFAIIVGTRPEIIKMAPVIRECERRKVDYRLVHSGQHYDHAMDRAIFEQFQLPDPHVNLRVGSGRHGEVTARILERFEAYILQEDIRAVLVHGDTNTTLAGALAAAKLNLPIGHVEAGLRSFDRTMPEEVNRVLADHVATHLFAPTPAAVDNLRAEGIKNGVYLTGQTAADAIEFLRPGLAEHPILNELHLKPGAYVYLTLHRQENTDHRERMDFLIQGIERVGKELGFTIVCALHPRTRGRLIEYGWLDRFYGIPGMRVVFPPVDVFASLALQSQAAVVLTDSGGLQEEACMLGVPCVTLRENTERPETLAIGSNRLAGYHPDTIVEAVSMMARAPRGWTHPYGDGRASIRILDIFLAE
ncbi:non-hydrolyzing UDP-N-acetylglucosamine 2-epimerase [Kyrpidia spormannii]|uniref:UDP-N-acetylglucosamine 2-epimerase n=1 Tax=Kyrpidia spormannii TaxID=2055160 RepID=A0ACA8ZA74_9BACL|nr:UDP-N-acetylglucosamine 2-epimerase (non-hydrolyzing) [Kyrpidia spormannii]CAB3393284.1 UDP-N-acetylglucosamine 2-epimerase [Kyrpidia spormannii]